MTVSFVVLLVLMGLMRVSADSTQPIERPGFLAAPVRKPPPPEIMDLFSKYDGDWVTRINRDPTTGRLYNELVEGDIIRRTRNATEWSGSREQYPSESAGIHELKAAAKLNSKVISDTLALDRRSGRNTSVPWERGGICLTCRYWPAVGSQYVVPYVIDPNFSAKSQSVIIWAMAYIESGSNVVFRERTTEPYWLEIWNGQDPRVCASSVGYSGTIGRQVLELADPYCIIEGVVIHELTHALGIDHEHQRPDRNRYITINKRNIMANEFDQFQIEAHLDGGQRTPYDYASIMHYQRDAFSADGGPVLEPENPNFITMLTFRRALYSPCDWAELSKIYPGPVKGPPCTPHVLGRGLVPSPKCLARFLAPECILACLFDSGTFLPWGYCTFPNGRTLPLPPNELPIFRVSRDIDPQGEIGIVVKRMRRLAGEEILHVGYLMAVLLFVSVIKNCAP